MEAIPNTPVKKRLIVVVDLRNWLIIPPKSFINEHSSQSTRIQLVLNFKKRPTRYLYRSVHRLLAMTVVDLPAIIITSEFVLYPDVIPDKINYSAIFFNYRIFV